MVSKSEWKCIRQLGQGSFGVVELWKNTKTGTMNAVKRFQLRELTSLKVTSEYHKLWKKEVELMRGMGDCPFIVSSYPVPPSLPLQEKDLVLFMEYCAGGTLRGVLKLPENICGLKEADGLEVLNHLGSAIEFLHNAGIVHRDLKPDNVLRCVNSDNKIIYKLSDLGLAKDVRQNDCSTFVGTLEYLAPEIYTGKGQPYDKTVDYWSFGIIAFEIMCGLRPFLPGEPPAVSLPLVEEKKKDVICIYRDGDGQIQCSNTIPFYSHFSEAKKECLLSWLRTMLQPNPALRGKRLSGDSVDIGLKLLQSTLSMKFLKIEAIKETLEFPIGDKGSRTKISDIQAKICMKLGVSPEDQLILSADGKKVDGPAANYDSLDLYFLPLKIDNIRLKVKFPVVVNNFIIQWDYVRDAVKLRRIWSCAIFFLQSELKKVDIVKKSIEALRLWCTVNYSNQLKALQMEVEKSGSSLGTIIELEEKLNAIDEKYSNECGPRRKNWGAEMFKIQSHYKDCFEKWWSDNVVLCPILTGEIEELYYKILKACSDWKGSDVTSSSFPYSYNETLVRLICQFIVKMQDIDGALLSNLKLLFDKIKADSKLMSEMNGILIKLNELLKLIMEERCEKQELQAKHLTGADIPSTLPQQQQHPDAYANAIKPVGRTVKRIVKSESKERSNGTDMKMTTSLTALDQFPLVSRLMQESLVLKAQTEQTIQDLSNSMSEIEMIRNENEAYKTFY